MVADSGTKQSGDTLDFRSQDGPGTVGTSMRKPLAKPKETLFLWLLLSQVLDVHSQGKTHSIKDLENMKKTLIRKKTSICPDTQGIQFLKYFVTVFYTSISMFIFNAFAFNRIYESRGKIALRERKFLC